MDLARRRAISGWMAEVWREASERGITDAEAVITLSHEAAMLLRAMVHSGDVRQTKIGVPVPLPEALCHCDQDIAAPHPMHPSV